MKTKLYLSLLVITTIFSACNSNQNSGGHTHDTVGGHQEHDDHGNEAGTLSYTLFSNDYELFVEFPPLTIGQTSTFAAHFTRLNTYKPVSEGTLTVSIVKGNKGIRHSVNSPSSPGIFRPALQPLETGTYRLIFELVSQTGNVIFEIPQVQVYANAQEAANASRETANGDEISYLKEQAWKADFATQEVSLKPFYSVIHTSAKVSGQPQSSVIVNSPAEGQITLFAVVGQSVKKGGLLAVVAGSGIENNINTTLTERKISFEKSRSDFLRTQPLAANQAVSQKDFLQIEAQYKQDSLRYYQLANQVSQNGLKITSPIDGFISQVSASNGQFVNNGAVVYNVGGKSKMLIEAFVNQADFLKVDGIFDANFSFSDWKESITLSELNGKVSSNNAFVSENNTRIPVTFSVLNNGKLMPGMFLETYLKTGKKENALVVPLSSIIEEQGQYFVFVQTGGESFLKRQIEITNTDGIYTEIASGLAVGERIVSKGAYQIKLAAMAGDLPLHGHTH
ncbi:MAG: efflux RND transporter periplasmic adaptor subunit [Breznakibacter sp.]